MAFQRGWKLVLRTKEVVKLRLTMGLTAARRAAAIAERWRNMVLSIGLWENELIFVMFQIKPDELQNTIRQE